VNREFTEFASLEQPSIHDFRPLRYENGLQTPCQVQEELCGMSQRGMPASIGLFRAPPKDDSDKCSEEYREWG
jgi:hypothetical protein